MKKTLKLTTALGTATVALAFAVTAASADTSLVNTGNNAEVDTGVNQTTTVNVTNSNTATINQSSFSLANSGANSTSGNIGGGSITSGDAVTSSELEVAANQNRTEITMPSSTAGSGDLDVVNTGRNLDLDARNTYRTTVTSNSTNVLDSSQTSFGLVNSGFNHTEGNIRGGDIDQWTSHDP